MGFLTVHRPTFPPMIRLAPVLFLLALAGCSTPKLTLELAESAGEITDADVEAGDALYAITENGLWGYMDRSGRVVIAPQFDFAAPFSEGRANVRMGGEWGFIAPSGAWVVRPRYDYVAGFSDGRALVGKGRTMGARRYGFIDAAGVEVVPTELPFAWNYSEGLALVRMRKNDTVGVLESLLARIGLRASTDTGYAFLDRDGTVAFRVPGLSAASFSGGLAPFERDRGWFQSSTWGYLDRDGNVAVAPTLDGPAFRHIDGLARAGESGQIGFIDREGAFVIAPEYDLAFAFADGLAPVKVDDLWGFVDTSGEVVISPQFRTALSFSEGLAPVQTETGWGFVNTSGDVVIPATYTRVDPFSRGLARVYENRLLRYVDASGAVVWAQP